MNRTTIADENKNTAELKQSQQFLLDVARAFEKAHLHSVADDLLSCETNFLVRVCQSEHSHTPKAVMLHCGRPICPVCAKRETERLLFAYLPALTSLLDVNSSYPTHKLSHFILTTPYSLSSLTSETFKQKQKLVVDYFNTFFFEYFQAKNELSKAEIKANRCNLAQHGIGGLQSAEFGERGKHLHWHILLYAPKMRLPDMWSVWRQVTHDECLDMKIKLIESNTADLRAKLREVTKYASKFTSLPARDFPKLYKVLKGNRRVRAFGILYNKTTKREVSDKCIDCGKATELVGVGEYLHRCEVFNIPPDDAVLSAVESGIFLKLFQDLEITSCANSSSTHKARDSIEGD